MKKDINIKKLIVNPENYRFDPVDNQEEAIDLMLEEKGTEIVNLAKHIFKYGIDRAKDSRVLEIKKDLFLILDGNRRATAIKCLQNQNIVKSDSLKTKFINILKGEGSIPNEINCFVYKGEEEAAEWIKIDHTGKNQGVGQDQWEPASKDRFDYKFGGKISPALQIVNLFEHKTKHQLNTKTLKMSTISRILSNPESRSYLGIDIRDGKVILITSQKEVVKRLDQLFNKIIIDNVLVKEVYRVQDSVRFMRNLFGDKPKPIKKEMTISPHGIIQKKGLSSRRSIPKSSSRNILIPKNCTLRIHEPKINNIYHELKSLKLTEGVNAIGVLLRVFLETSLDYYAYKNGTEFGDKTKLAGKITKITNDLEKKEVATSQQLRNIRTVSNKGVSILSINHFHEYVHSFKTQPVPIDLIYKWDNLQEFFEILWAEVSKNKKQRKKI